MDNWCKVVYGFFASFLEAPACLMHNNIDICQEKNRPIWGSKLSSFGVFRLLYWNRFCLSLSTSIMWSSLLMLRIEQRFWAPFHTKVPITNRCCYHSKSKSGIEILTGPQNGEFLIKHSHKEPRSFEDKKNCQFC